MIPRPVKMTFLVPGGTLEIDASGGSTAKAEYAATRPLQDFGPAHTMQTMVKNLAGRLRETAYAIEGIAKQLDGKPAEEKPASVGKPSADGLQEYTLRVRARVMEVHDSHGENIRLRLARRDYIHDRDVWIDKNEIVKVEP